jgi:hypothetical protein
VLQSAEPTAAADRVPVHFGGCDDLLAIIDNLANHLSLNVTVVHWYTEGVGGCNVPPRKGRGRPVEVTCAFFLYRVGLHWQVIYPHPSFQTILGDGN